MSGDAEISSSKLLRILMVSEDIPDSARGGLVKHAVTLGNVLIEQGHQVTLMGYLPRRGDKSSDEDIRKEIGFQGPYLSALPRIAGWSELRWGFYFPQKRPYFAKRFAKVLESYAHQFDVIHYHGHLPMVAKYLPRSVKFVQTRHDQGSECITYVRFKNNQRCESLDIKDCAACIRPAPNLLQEAVTVSMVKRFRSEIEDAFRQHPVIYVSDMLRRHYRRVVPHADQRQSHVIHNFVDEHQLHQYASRPLSHPPGVSQVIHVAARLDEAKGVFQFIESLMPKLPQNWCVRVLGDGPLRYKIETQFAHDKRLLLLGHQSYENTVASAAGADVIVVPSICEEACSTVVLEALRLGKSCYALVRGGTPELSIYGEPGQLVLFDSMDQLTTELCRQQQFTHYSGGMSADVRQKIPQLLHLYQA